MVLAESLTVRMLDQKADLFAGTQLYLDTAHSVHRHFPTDSQRLRQTESTMCQKSKVKSLPNPDNRSLRQLSIRT